MKALKIIGIIVAVIVAYIGLELIPGFIASRNNNNVLNSNKYVYRINNITDLKITPYDKGTYSIYEFKGDSSEAYLFAFRCDTADSRLSYLYACELDTLCLNAYFSAPQVTLLNEKKPFFSSRITREYQIEESYRVKTVTIFARQYIYLFIQVYDTEPELLNRLLEDFKSPRTYSVKNLIAKWQDQLSGESKGWGIFWSVIGYVIRCLIATVLFYLLFFGLPEFLEKKNVKIPTIITILIAFFIFTYITLHDYFMEWIMGYGSFISIILGVLSMFLDD